MESGGPTTSEVTKIPLRRFAQAIVLNMFIAILLELQQSGNRMKPSMQTHAVDAVDAGLWLQSPMIVVK
ncbi:hypothetical protein GCM10011363_39280 [Marivita lacus]|uniref:Uncharacterized protein n=1 Tax=Marivita lacus TaxID=1323742 RepID=A0ABQ1L2W1_9RHOB|nr:hypothetical protein [Marivita lacus]GGC18776.1 hypothetical protein GCM10011363_39280 [Marivita lacus]